MELKDCNKKELMYIIGECVGPVLLKATLAEVEYMRMFGVKALENNTSSTVSGPPSPQGEGLCRKRKGVMK